MTQKELFIEKLRVRTKQLAIEVIMLCNELNKAPASKVISYQLIKSSTSVAANYRAACRSRSKAEFRSKMSIVVEEADETSFWLELIDEIGLSKENQKIASLKNESEEIIKIMSKARSTSY